MAKKPLVRQSAFRVDGTVTDVPTQDSERPQLEKKADLFEWGDDQAKLKRLIESADGRA